MPKLVSETINGKEYTSLISIAKAFKISEKTVYARHGNGKHGKDLIAPIKTRKSSHHKVSMKIDNKTYKSLSGIASALQLSYKTVKDIYDNTSTLKEFQNTILAIAKGETSKGIKPKVTKSKKTKPKPKVISTIEIPELRDASVQKVGALSSLLLTFMAEFTGYTVDVNAFENAYDRGLDLSLAQFLSHTDKKEPASNIVSKETITKIADLQSENEKLSARLEKLEESTKSQSKLITTLTNDLKEAKTKKKHWWSK